jgi:hypothetical protein
MGHKHNGDSQLFFASPRYPVSGWLIVRISKEAPFVLKKLKLYQRMALIFRC